MLAISGAVQGYLDPVTETSVVASTTVTSSPQLERRWKEVVQPNKDYENKLSQKKSLELAKPKEIPKSWIRTISSSVVEIVQPTVIASVTFSAKPPATTNGLEPWVSLNKDGTPKTIKPQNKNGNIKNGKPDYGTWFQDVHTVTYSHEELKAHNMKPGETFEEVIYDEEDQTYVSLNPLIRCTPDRYYMKGLAKDISSSPFCTPREKSDLKLDKTYFVTWFTKYFPAITENVRIHLAYVKESEYEKGMSKREFMDFSNDGALPGTFFTSDWILNRDGYFPLEVQEEWLKSKFNKKVLITIQPDSIADEEFDILNSNGTVVTFLKGAVVAKTTKEQKEIQDQGGSDSDNIYYVILIMPTMVILAACVMYFFVFITKGTRDFSSVRKSYFKRKFGKRNYDKLPQHKADIALKRL